MPPASPSSSPEPGTRRRVAIIGMPNTGKSTFFNRLTGASARIGNWPGVTVDLLSARLIVGDSVVEVVDLPGIYDMRGFSDDEAVVREFLTRNPVDLVALVVNAVQIERQLHIALQIKALGLPAVLFVNMKDEADQMGIRIQTDVLSQKLGMPVVAISAKLGQGMNQVIPTFQQGLAGSAPVQVPDSAFAALPEDSMLRMQTASLAQAAVDVPALASDKFSNRLDHWLLHPWLGLPLFFGILFLLFEAVYLLGAPLQDGVDFAQGWLKAEVLTPLLSWAPPLLSGFLLDGLWDGLATVATFVPIIIIFFLFMAVVEDTGYFSRAAYLMDAFMARMGLDGRSFVMILMGFGCNVPALMGTRVMRSRKLRLLTMLIIPFSLCSARLQVFLFLTTILFTGKQAPLVLFSLYFLSVFTAVVTAFLFKSQFKDREPFVLELPPYRLPTVRMLWLRAWQEARHFLNRATKFITLGVALVWAMTHLPPGVPVAGAESLAGMVGAFFEPILSPIGIDGQMAIALIFGFVAKEIVVGSLAVIYGLEGDALSHQIAQSMDWVQCYSFMIFTLVYTPCLSTVATLLAESKSRAYTAFAVAWPLGLAWVASFVFYQGARALGF
ncbi:MAG TPA: ferrous iron transport protein B [Fluviicoccus sp.]|nr:ferrous iron transport protein B [Fluviicoccus sp.]